VGNPRTLGQVVNDLAIVDAGAPLAGRSVFRNADTLTRRSPIGQTPPQ
jgi:hypothetical protein